MVAGLLALSTLLALACIATVVVYEIRLNAALTRQVTEEEEQIDKQKQDIVQLHLQIGVTAVEGGDTFEAVLHFTEALRLDKGTDRERHHRTRIGTALRQCPRLINMLTLDQTVLCADHERVVTIGANQAIDVRKMYTAQPIVSGLRHTEPPYKGMLSPDGRFLGVVGSSGAARIWNLSTNEPHDLRSGEPHGVQRLVFHPNGRVLLAQRGNSAMEAWDLVTWMQLPWDTLTKGKELATLSDDGRWLFTCDVGHIGQIWDLETGNSRGAPLKFGHPINASSVSPEGTRVAVIGPDNELSIWDVLTNTRLKKQIQLPGAVSQIVFSPDAESVATVCNDRIVRILQIQTGALAAQTSPLEDAITSVQFSADGHFLLVKGENGGARVWDVATGQAATPPLRHGGRLASAVFRANGAEVVTVSNHGLVCVWEMPHGPEVRRRVAGDMVPSPDSSGKGRSISLANGLIVQANSATDGSLKPSRQGERVVQQAVLSPDGLRVAVCEGTTTVLVWNTTGGESSTPPLRHRSPVRYAAFSSDGKRILTACEDRTVRLWDTATGELLGPPMRHALAIQRVSFHDSDTQARVVHEGGTVSIWDFREDMRPLEDLLTLAQIIAGRHSDPNHGQQSLDSRSLWEKWEKLSALEKARAPR
jgi:WD40 repeat protein